MADLNQSGRVHVVRRWPCGGGMQAILDLHLDAGEALVALTGDPDRRHGVRQLDLLPGTSLREASRRLHSTLGDFPGADVLFYNACALEWMHSLQDGHRHFLYLHSDYPRLETWLRRVMPHADGCLCVNPLVAARIERQTGPAGPPIHTLPLPVEPPSDTGQAPPGAGSPLVIGYSGRVETAQKRLDRLPAFMAELDRLGLDYRLELLGTGNYLGTLRNRLGAHPGITFHGHREGRDYWEIVGSWKYILFLSDYEGLPISLLEAVSCGAVPVYPDFHNGEDWVSSLAKGLLYPMGDVAAAAQCILKLEQQWDEPDWARYRDAARRLLQAHDAAGYFAAMETAMRETPRSPAAGRPRRRTSPQWWPYWLYNRVRRYRQFGTIRRKGGK